MKRPRPTTKRLKRTTILFLSQIIIAITIIIIVIIIMIIMIIMILIRGR
jgi:uncharacterized membrane protein